MCGPHRAPGKRWRTLAPESWSLNVRLPPTSKALPSSARPKDGRGGTWTRWAPRSSVLLTERKRSCSRLEGETVVGGDLQTWSPDDGANCVSAGGWKLLMLLPKTGLNYQGEGSKVAIPDELGHRMDHLHPGRRSSLVMVDRNKERKKKDATL